MLYKLPTRGGAYYEAREARASPLFEIYYRGHSPKSPKNAIKINSKKYTPPEPHHFFRACAATDLNIVQFGNFMVRNVITDKLHIVRYIQPRTRVL